MQRQNSFAQWGVDTFGEDFLEKYWDYDKNSEDPWIITPQSTKEVWIKCQEVNYHTYSIKCSHFYRGNRCGYCHNFKVHPLDSFAQWGIDTLGEDFLEKYWDYDKNTVDPWDIKPQHNGTIFVYCQEKGYHSSYDILCYEFYRGKRCSYCNGFKVHPLDSFAQWGIDIYGNGFLEKYWDYHRNTEDPWFLSAGSKKRIYIYCQTKDYHGSYKTNCYNFKKGYTCSFCASKNIHPLDSFAQWGIDTLGEDFLEKYWDYNKNTVDPWEFTIAAHIKIFIKCQNRFHNDSYEIDVNHFYRGNRCGSCRKDFTMNKSFAQWGIETFGDVFLQKYWDYARNVENPWLISKNSIKTIYINCHNKTYHGSYETNPSKFVIGQRCPNCASKKLHVRDSLGTLYPKVFETWSEKNVDSPYNYSPFCSNEAVFFCNIHGEYVKKIYQATYTDFRCPHCCRERDESIMQEKVRIFLVELGYALCHEDKCSLKPINPKTNKILKFDNEVIGLDLIIEVYGEQHYRYTPFWQKTIEEFHDLKWRDKFKKDYALNNGYFYLEIPYWTQKNDEYKKLIIEKINQINRI